jgi:ribonucleases P/MRP protein subunit RPP40
LLKLNPKVCKVLHITQSEVAEHCNKAAKKAMRVLTMVKRTLLNEDETTLKILYLSFERSHLEYCIQAWAPYLKKNMTKLEKEYVIATKLVFRLRKFPNETRLEISDLYPLLLKQKRLHADLIETFKIMRGIEDFDLKMFFLRANTSSV